MKKKVLLLGARGNIGSGFAEEYLNEGYDEKYDLILGVHDRKFKDSRFKVVYFSLEDSRSLNRVMKGVDVIILLAANPSPEASFEELLPSNIVGVNNVFEIAVKNKVGRVIFASSVHAVYDNLKKIKVSSGVYPMPGDLYGVTKIFGESLCYIYSRNEGLSCLAIRIGAYTSNENLKNICFSRLDYEHAISQRDMSQLLHRAILAPSRVRFGIFNGVSKNKKMDMSLKEARKVLGYKPQDDMYKICKELKMVGK